METADILAYGIAIPAGTTLIVLTITACATNFFSKPKLHTHEDSYSKIKIPARRGASEELYSAIQESESLASAVSNPIADPVVHLRGAAKVFPTNYQDTAKKVLDHLNSTRVVILDLATADENLASRLVDFSSGVTLGSKGWLYSVSSTTILLAPQTE